MMIEANGFKIPDMVLQQIFVDGLNHLQDHISKLLRLFPCQFFHRNGIERPMKPSGIDISPECMSKSIANLADLLQGRMA